MIDSQTVVNPDEISLSDQEFFLFECQMVNSTAIQLVAYNGYSMTLRLYFVGGNAYDYFNVDRDLFEMFCESESVGKFYNQYIKGKFPGTLLDKNASEGFWHLFLKAFKKQRVLVRI